MSFVSRMSFCSLLESVNPDVLIIFNAVIVLQWFDFIQAYSMSIARQLREYGSVCLFLSALWAQCQLLGWLKRGADPKVVGIIHPINVSRGRFSFPSFLTSLSLRTTDWIQCTYTTPLPLIQLGPFARTSTAAQILASSSDYREWAVWRPGAYVHSFKKAAWVPSKKWSQTEFSKIVE